MAHPNLRRSSTPRAVAMAGVAGAALLLPIGPVAALALGQSTVELPMCAGAGDAVVELCEIPDTSVGTLQGMLDSDSLPLPDTDLLAPVTGLAGQLPVGDLPVEVLPSEDVEESEASPGQVEEVAPPAAPATGSSSGATSSSSGAASADDEPAKVGAAGKNTTEVVEPQAPAADGRIVDAPGTAVGPTLQPMTNLGVNIPSVRSQSGLTLQPYDAPIVSIPMEYEVPRIAAPTVSTATPIQAAAVEAIRFTGESLVPYASGSGAWVTAAGLGLLGVAGFATRRRMDSLSFTTLDS